MLRIGVSLLLLSASSSVWATELRIAYSSPMLYSRWNNFTFAADASDLIDYDTGLYTNIDIVVSGWTHQTIGPYLWPYDTMEWIREGVGRGAATRFGPGVSTLSFSQLSGPWRVEILSSMDPRPTTTPTNFTQDITVNGQFADQDYQHLGANGDDFNACIDGQVAANWLIWTAVAPENGIITLQFDSSGVADGCNIANAIRLLSVPEPSPLILLGIVAVGLIGHLWHKRRQ